MVLTTQFTKWRTLAYKEGCQGLSYVKKSGTCQHVLLQFVPTVTLETARRRAGTACSVSIETSSIVCTVTVGKKHKLPACWMA
jgi:hypothetical protein